MASAGYVGERKKVVVVGGGIGGSLVARTLQDHADVCLIDEKEYFEITWTSMRSKVEPSFAKRAVMNHEEYLPKARVIASAATGITDREVSTAQGRQTAYDYLVVATGHVGSGAYTREQRLKQFEEEHDKIKSANSILIVGGGPTGVELAAEIATDFPTKKVVLVHRGARLLEFVSAKAGKKALNWLTSKKVEVILNQSVKLNSESHGVYETSGGETINADCHFLCTGVPSGSSWLRGTILKDSLDVHGRLMVDKTLRVKGYDNIFAIGDITDVPEIKQGYLAEVHAAVVAKNVKELMKKTGQKESKLATYKAASANAVVSLGRKEGLMQLMCITMVGRFPGKVKSEDLFVSKTRKGRGLKSKLP